MPYPLIGDDDELPALPTWLQRFLILWGVLACIALAYLVMAEPEPDFVNPDTRPAATAEDRRR